VKEGTEVVEEVVDREEVDELRSRVEDDEVGRVLVLVLVLVGLMGVGVVAVLVVLVEGRPGSKRLEKKDTSGSTGFVAFWRFT
jgi:hypothetical protein